jgi:leucyl aminopeptidase (aminopeptidase T)
MVYETFDAHLVIEAFPNRHMLSGINPERMTRRNKAQSELHKTFLERATRGEFYWCISVYPNNANAQAWKAAEQTGGLA